MKKFIGIIIFIVFVTLAVPAIVVNIPWKNNNEKTHTALSAQEKGDTIKVYIKNEDRVCEMDTVQYLKEVVSAEMPASFHEEALKAQAVAARTYLISRKNAGGSDVHKGADICTDSTHCKAWISEEERRKSWGTAAEENWQKISEAVTETDGIIITYENQPISAVFHSTSSGRTENAKDVWGGNVPYLVSVESEGDVESPKYNSGEEYTIAEFKEICEKNIDGINWEEGLFSDISRSEAGGIISMKIGGVTLKGAEFRSIFSLRSANIDIKEENERIIMTVKGYGHGVGMSQYGANYLAAQGADFETILKTYYTGVEIE